MPQPHVSDRGQFFHQVLEMVRLIPIRDIVEGLYHVPKGFCPFHNDRHAGSFSLYKKKNTYHCFSCGASGDGIDFVQKQEGIGFKPAVWKLALQFGIVTPEQVVEFYKKGTLENRDIQAPPRTYTDIYVDGVEEPVADPDILHAVYTVFSEGEGLLKKNGRLSEKHRDYLLRERKLSPEDIERGGYFTMPRRTNYFMREFLKALKERHGYDEDVLKEVPGFYYLEKNGGMTFVGHKGIGIPIRDERGRICGIQIRRDQAKKGEQRYIWFSSSFANEKEGMGFGTGSGAPVHVSYPERLDRPHDLYITEGVFKSEQLAKVYHAISVSLQGVQSWRGKLERIFDYLEAEKGQAVLSVHVFFDSDMCENPNVYFAFREMVLALKHTYRNLDFYYYWWDPGFGKGFDDLVLNGFFSEVKRVDYKSYIRAYDKMIATLEKQHDEPIVKIDKEFIQEAFEKDIRPLFVPVGEMGGRSR
jgi:DNA primase